MKHRLLMLGSVPLAEPWNGADKNLAGLLVRRDRYNQFIVHTSADEPWPPPPRVTAIRSRRASSMPTVEQRVRGLSYMLRHSGSADLIHVVASLYGPARWTGPALRAWSALRQRPIVHTIPSIGDIPIERRNFAGDATVVVSEHTRGRLEDHGIPNVLRVHPPLEIENLRPKHPTAPEALVRDLRLGERAVLYPAHFGEDSGIREIIRAFSGLRGTPDTDGAVLVLALRSHPWQDAGAERRRVLELAAEAGVGDRVRILGHVPDMPALISACAVTALVPRKLSAKMDLPMVILEALALGRPVIVGDRPPISEALLGGGGYAVPFGDVPALSAALSGLLGNPDLRARLAGRGKAAVSEHCSPEEVIERYQRIYDLVPGPNRTRDGGIVRGREARD